MQRLAVSGAVLVLALAACGGGSGGGSTYNPPAGGGTSTSAPSSSPAVASEPQTATVGSGSAFVSSANQHTLYVFGADTTDASNCTSSNGCTTNWPPYMAAAGAVAPAGSGFSIFPRSDGSGNQWAYNGMPLYEFVNDSSAGTQNGNGITAFGGLWTTARPASATPAPGPTNTPYAVRR